MRSNDDAARLCGTQATRTQTIAQGVLNEEKINPRISIAPNYRHGRRGRSNALADGAHLRVGQYPAAPADLYPNPDWTPSWRANVFPDGHHRPDGHASPNGYADRGADSGRREHTDAEAKSGGDQGSGNRDNDADIATAAYSKAR